MVTCFKCNRKGHYANNCNNEYSKKSTPKNFKQYKPAFSKSKSYKATTPSQDLLDDFKCYQNFTVRKYSLQSSYSISMLTSPFVNVQIQGSNQQQLNSYQPPKQIEIKLQNPETIIIEEDDVLKLTPQTINIENQEDLKLTQTPNLFVKSEMNRPQLKKNISKAEQRCTKLFDTLNKYLDSDQQKTDLVRLESKIKMIKD